MENLLKDFTPVQIEAIKLVVRKGFWGDTDMEFGNDEKCHHAYGYRTNGISADKKVFSGIMSGIGKQIKSSGSDVLTMVSDWWGDGKRDGDMLFVNMSKITSKELHDWARS